MESTDSEFSVVYEPTRSDNELHSADLFLTFCKEASCVPQADQECVFQWIMDTLKHEGLPHQGNCDLNLFIDMDLSILGAIPSDYRLYATQIRREYIHVADESYQKGRASVLTHFLPQSGKFIFQSVHFRALLEEPAKANLRWEIAQLASGLVEERSSS